MAYLARAPRASARVTPPGPDLAARIAARIKTSGPITIADYMTACLLDPVDGYYTTRDPLGAGGDFITAPEVSQMFGELLGLSLAQSWLDQGAPDRFILAELGPGRGTLMSDALRATAAVPGFNTAAQLHLVEASPALRARQAQTLAKYAPHWHADTAEMPDGPLFLIANEFFDALPIRQFRRTDAGWAEHLVGLKDGTLVPGLAPPTALAALQHRLDDTRPGDVVELAAPAQGIATRVAQRIARFGGAALILDYGDWRSLGDTLQAVRAHSGAGLFDAPGATDLTAHVDFEVLANAARDAGAHHSRLTPQGVFLERLGIGARAQALTKGVGADQVKAVAEAHHRLTHPAEMGTLFKSLAIYPDGTEPPAGFAH